MLPQESSFPSKFSSTNHSGVLHSSPDNVDMLANSSAYRPPRWNNPSSNYNKNSLLGCQRVDHSSRQDSSTFWRRTYGNRHVDQAGKI